MKYIVCLTLLLSMGMLSACDGISRQFNNLFGSSTASNVATGDFDTPPQVLANNAETAYRDGNYDEAAEMYQQIKDRYPYSRYALLAELRLGDTYFKSERYEESALSYEDFIRLHPRNEAVPYALYQMGMTYHAQMTTPDRDSSSAARALEIFKRLRSNYPDNEFSHQAAPRMEECIANLAAHDMSVGDFYRHRDRYEAAIGRYRQVITQYPDAGFYKEAMHKIKECEAILAALTPEEREERSQNRREIFVPPPSMMGISGIIGPTAIGF